MLLNLMTHGGPGPGGELSGPDLGQSRSAPTSWLGVAALHLGIGLTLGLFEFSLAMMAANLAFVSGPWLRSLVTPGTSSSRRVGSSTTGPARGAGRRWP